MFVHLIITLILLEFVIAIARLRGGGLRALVRVPEHGRHVAKVITVMLDFVESQLFRLRGTLRAG